MNIINTEYCVHPYSQLRNRAPTSDKEFDRKGMKRAVGSRPLLNRVGKYTALILEYTAVHAGKRGLSLVELAGGLDRRPYNIAKSKAFENLLSSGLLVRDDGFLNVPDDLEWRLEIELEQSGCVEARRLDSARYARERKAFRRRGENKPDVETSEEDLQRAHLACVEVALAAFTYEGSGPQRILHTYIDGATQFEYVVKAVVTTTGLSRKAG